MLTRLDLWKWGIIDTNGSHYDVFGRRCRPLTEAESRQYGPVISNFYRTGQICKKTPTSKIS